MHASHLPVRSLFQCLANTVDADVRSQPETAAAPPGRRAAAEYRAVLNRLLSLVEQLGHWSYLIIFLGATLESAAFLGVAVPGESLVLLGGFLAARGVLHVGDLVVLVCVGAILGDSIGYELGRFLGRPWLLRYGHWVGLRGEHVARVDGFFHRHGGKTVLIGRFVGFLRALAPFVAGASGMLYRRFLLYNALGAVVWSVSFVLLGYFVGASWALVEHWVGRASAVLAVVLLLVAALAYLWRWLIRHEAALRRRWAALLAHQRVAPWHRRLAPLLAFLQTRLSPGEYLGLRLTVGAVVLVGATWLFGGIAQDVVAGDPLTVVDQHLGLWLQTHATPGFTTAMRIVSQLGRPLLIAAATALTALALVLRRRWYALLTVALVIPGGTLLNVLLRALFRRTPPSFATLPLPPGGYSFPSEYVMGTVVLYGLLALFAAQAWSSWRWRVSAVLAAVFVITLVGFSLVYLGSHYLSDVLAAAAEGVAWLALCVTAVDTLERSRSTTVRR
jgi:membrane protein DedA with SNARE-associated domain/membrane-associated phospholipid phosphatase